MAGSWSGMASSGKASAGEADERGLKVGDHAEWNSRVAHREGHITEKLTHDKGGTRASEAHPKFVVVDDGRGKEYARNPDKLHKVEDDAV